MGEQTWWRRLWRTHAPGGAETETAVTTMQTEFPFVLPRGYLDAGGRLHRQGRMRLAMAYDEMEAAADLRVQANPAYLPALLLSRVVVRLGELPAVTPDVTAGLFAVDLAFLEGLYQRVNSVETLTIGASCPQCNCRFHVQLAPLPGEEVP